MLLHNVEPVCDRHEGLPLSRVESATGVLSSLELPLDCSCSMSGELGAAIGLALNLGLSLSAAMYVAIGAAPEHGERPLLLRCRSLAAGAVPDCNCVRVPSLPYCCSMLSLPKPTGCLPPGCSANTWQDATGCTACRILWQCPAVAHLVPYLQVPEGCKLPACLLARAGLSGRVQLHLFSSTTLR